MKLSSTSVQNLETKMQRIQFVSLHGEGDGFRRDALREKAR